MWNYMCIRCLINWSNPKVVPVYSFSKPLFFASKKRKRKKLSHKIHTLSSGRHNSVSQWAFQLNIAQATAGVWDVTGRWNSRTGKVRITCNNEARSCNYCCSGKAVSTRYLFCVCVCSLTYPACKVNVPYCHPWPVRPYKTFSHYTVQHTKCYGNETS